MASQININVKPLIKYVDRYNPKSIRRAVYMSTNRVGFLVSKEKIPNKYKQIFKQESQQLTLKSLNYKADKNKITFSTIKDAGKGNPPSKYLYPVIGGGSNQVYLTTFVRWLHRNNYAFKSQYPIANLKSDFIKPGRKKPDTVLPAVYANVQRALRKTAAKGTKYNAQGQKIQDARVFAKKDSFGKYKPGIYRVKADEGKKGMIKPLFIYGKLPSIKAKDEYGKQIMTIINREFPKILNESINKYGKSI